MRDWIVGTIVALVVVALLWAYFADIAGHPSSTDQRLSEYRPAAGVVCYAFAGVPQSLSCVREAP